MRTLYLIVWLVDARLKLPVVSTATSIQSACTQAANADKSWPEYYVQVYELTPRYENTSGLFGWDQRKIACKAKAPQETVWEADYEESK